MSNLPPPTSYGAPAKFDHWRPYQESAVLKIIDNTPARFIVQVQPTGSGKSLCYIMAAVLSGLRVLILTSTKALQDQIMADFGEAFHIADVRGQSGYICLKDVNGNTTVEDGICHTGYVCELKDNGCTYYDAIRKAKSSQIVVSNYAFWLTSAKYGDTIGKFDMLILDESHDAPEWVMKAVSASINERDAVNDLGIELPLGVNVDSWKAWSEKVIPVIDDKIAKVSQSTTLKSDITNIARVLRLRRIHRSAGNIVSLAANNMVVDRETVYGYALVEPITAIELAEKLLFRDIGKIVLTSATIRPKTMWMMGLTKKDQIEGRLIIEEYPSQFEVWRRQVTYIPTVRVQHDMQSGDVKRWVAQIDNIIRKRQDRKGIIHSISYNRMKQIMSMSEFGKIMIGHDKRTLNSSIRQFRTADPPLILVSPSIDTGYDFPYESCEYQIIAKVPFPDSRSSSMKARTKRDSEYGYYIAMQSIIQASGRGCRAEDDQCECFIVDDNWGWFVSKWKQFAPRWFLDACQSKRTIPEPPKPLNRRE